MKKEIGSNFSLSPSMNLIPDRELKKEDFGVTGADSVFLSTGRGAEDFILKTIEQRNSNMEKVALIPPFTCGTIIHPFVERRYRIFTYQIDERLNTDVNEFENILQQTNAQVVLLHRYFGFDTLAGFAPLIQKYQKKGIVFIEDRTQVIYSSCPELNTEYVCACLRKWMDLPDGGLAVCRKGELLDKPIRSDRKLEKQKITASRNKYRYLYEDSGDKQIFLSQFRQAEQTLNEEKEYYRISPASEAIWLQTDIDYIKKRRRDNYRYLYKEILKLDICALVTPEIVEDEVPLYVVLSLDNREKLQALLRRHDIYAPIVWSKAEECPGICKQAQKLYETVLCLPIDQRYELDDMERIVDCLKGFKRSMRK